VTLDELARTLAEQKDLSVAKSREVIHTVFEEIRRAVLERGERFVMPQFGAYSRRVTPGGLRPVGGQMKQIPTSKRIVFRVSTGSKRSE
jgi:nucleoid DNA-binding protein